MADARPANPAHQHYQQALALLSEDRLPEAEQECRRSLALAPQAAPAANILAIILARTGRGDEAVTVLKDALARWPEFVPALTNLGIMLHGRHRHTEALTCFERVLAVDPSSRQARFQIACALVELGRTADAIEAFGEAVRHDPDNASARHMLAALRGETTEAPPIAFVRGLFDEYAGTFERNVVQDLGYDVPRRLRRMVDALRPRRFVRALDLGCGTGLVGRAFADIVDAFVGVDVSANMIEEARKAGVYRELHAMEIMDYLRGQASLPFDLVTAADVFIYVGKLDALFAEVARRLASGGLFGFSIEHADGADCVLRPSGRYAHSGAYIERLAPTHGFTTTSRHAAVIRTGYAGELFLLQRA